MDGFIYIWKDIFKNKFYIGSHMGSTDDGYTGSGMLFLNAYNKRPDSFRRRILEHHFDISKEELHNRETLWLQLIPQDQLGKKFYNLKRVAAGGDIVSDLSEEKRQQHKEKSLAARYRGKKKWMQDNPEIVSQLAKERRAKVKNPSGGRNYGPANGFYGKKHTDETLKRMSEAKKGKPSNRKGIPHTDETKKKLSANSANHIDIMTPYGEFRSYASFCMFMNNSVSDATIRIIMKNPDKVVTTHQACRSPLFTESDIGKTYKELGWYLV